MTFEARDRLVARASRAAVAFAGGFHAAAMNLAVLAAASLGAAMILGSGE